MRVNRRQSLRESLPCSPIGGDGDGVCVRMNPSTEVTSGGNGGWRESYRTAQMITLPDVTRVCGSKAGQLVIDLAQGTGCPHEYVLMPLLSICAGEIFNAQASSVGHTLYIQALLYLAV